jgi:hypothetical protein
MGTAFNVGAEKYFPDVTGTFNKLYVIKPSTTLF